MTRLSGRTAVVTGGTRGLGARIARMFLQEGADVVVASREKGEWRPEPGAGGGRIAYHPVDVRDPDSATELMRAAADRFGGVDILVANAGVSRPGAVEKLAPDHWAEVLDTNVTGVFHCARAAIQFYAWQMGLIDDRKAEEWADTFTEDAVFEEASRMDPLRGRAAIAASCRKRADRLEAERTDFRHWLGMLDVHAQPDGSLRTRTYALAMRTRLDGPLEIFPSVVCRDHLVPRNNGWLVSHRVLQHDGSGR
ncbi:SDR family NAD(P)-dependent oxidoreductase [Streptomyces sp.]|uniref:SDR family NAD(P)-dependent oxidoreductase n=1 Tax=Streptomyces sp. TaxID=1931 RepID=UPI002810B652|nr:SDR family NAD(P)-dependent oxidoreductase [Streptomyces sp.]